MGLARQYESFENRPVHPLTGLPADYYWEKPDGTRTPHWYAGHEKRGSVELSWFKTDEVAKMLGVTARRVRQLIKSRAIPSTVFGNKHFVSGATILSWTQGQTKVAPLPEALPR